MKDIQSPGRREREGRLDRAERVDGRQGGQRTGQPHARLRLAGQPLHTMMGGRWDWVSADPTVPESGGFSARMQGGLPSAALQGPAKPSGVDGKPGGRPCHHLPDYPPSRRESRRSGVRAYPARLRSCCVVPAEGVVFRSVEPPIRALSFAPNRANWSLVPLRHVAGRQLY